MKRIRNTNTICGQIVKVLYMKTGVVNNQDLNSGVPYSAVEAILVLQSAMPFPVWTWPTYSVSYVYSWSNKNNTIALFFFGILSCVVISYVVAETGQLYASDLPFWSLMYDQLNSARIRALTYKGWVKKDSSPTTFSVLREY